MRALTAQQILQVWEIGQSQHPIDRALTLLSFGLPDRTAEELIHLSIGQRDAYLLHLREITLGPRLESVAQCPQCQESLEFTIEVADLKVMDPNQVTAQEHVLTTEEFELQFNLPNSRDLAAVVGCRDLRTAQRMLAQRCIQQVRHPRVAIDTIEVPEALLTQLSEQIAACDPQAEILLNLDCPACQYAWQVLFDIVTFFWAELSTQARRLFQEVHTLARFYGWREADILAMSPKRRQVYLDMVS